MTARSAKLYFFFFLYMQAKLLNVSTLSSPKIRNGFKYFPKDLTINKSIALINKLELILSYFPFPLNDYIVNLLIFCTKLATSSVKSKGAAFNVFFSRAIKVRCKSFS